MALAQALAQEIDLQQALPGRGMIHAEAGQGRNQIVDIDRAQLVLEQALRHAALQNALDRLQRRLAQQLGLGDLAQHLAALEILLQHQTRELLVLLVILEAPLRQRMQRLQGLQRIEIELTEAVALKHPEQAAHTIRKLHAAGFRVALDDFGTGYSSMSYLKRYAIDKLKIDQSFVRELAHQASDQAIVTAIIKMAHSLRMATIAEGVETVEQAALLQACGCDEMQGYWYSRPLEPAAFEAFVRNAQAGVELA